MLVSIGLALCVFLWGLQYKISLYYPPRASFHQVPKAKLLSEKRQSTISEGSTRPEAKIPAKVFRGVADPHLFILVAVFLLGLQIVVRNQRWANASWRIRRVTLDAFFVRPPPFLA